jgi:RNA polymerase sigma-70 factor (ECF subfamily)
MAAAEHLPDWAQRLREGDAAAEKLFGEYARRLTHVAEQHLSARLAGRVDGEDVVQSVFRTFFRRSARGEFRIDTSEQIWRLLVRITILKARARGRQHTAARRDVAAEAEDAEGWLEGAVSQDPGPAEVAELVDLVEHLMEGLPPLYCHILDLRLQGHDVVGIAEQLTISRRTVQRTLSLLRQRLTATLTLDDA